METHLVAVYAHVLLGIALVGFALFFALVSARGERSAAESDSLLDLVRRTSWPPRGLPVPVRLPLWAVGWVLLAGVALTGVLAIGWSALQAAVTTGPFVLVGLRTKLVLVGVAALCLAVASVKPRRGVLVALLACLLVVVVLSGLLVR